MTGRDKLILLKNACVIDGNGGPALKNKTIVIEGKIIKSISDSEQNIQQAEKVVDCSGKTIIPGMMDAHCHNSLDGGYDLSRAVSEKFVAQRALTSINNYRKCLEAGFTTVRELGTVAYIDVAIRDMVNSGQMVGPRILASGKGLSQTGGHADSLCNVPWNSNAFEGISEVADGPDACRKAVRKQIGMKVNVIKMFITGGISDPIIGRARTEFTEAEMQAIIEEAHIAGRKVAAHCQNADAAKKAIKYGVDSIEHGVLMDEECLDMMANKGTYWVPTISILKNLQNGEKAGVPFPRQQLAEFGLSKLKELFKMAIEKNVLIAVGTDTGVGETYAGNNADELVYMHQWGLSAMNCLVAATKTNSCLFGIDDKVGTIEQGKDADLLILKENPLDNIELVRKHENIDNIMIAGQFV